MKKFKMRYAHPIIEEQGKMIYVKEFRQPFYVFTSDFKKAAMYDQAELQQFGLKYLKPVGVVVSD